MPTYTAEMEEPAPATLCDGCGCAPRPFSAVAPVVDCLLTPGDDSPAGRCPDPDCQGLVYVITDRTKLRDAAQEMLAALRVAADALTPPNNAEERAALATVNAAIARATT